MIPRKLDSKILQAMAEFPVVYVNGPRQAGKSTLVQALTREEWPAEYVTFDEATVMGAADANPESFLRGFEGSLVLDEVQMVPGLFRALKLLVDESRIQDTESVNGRFLLTGTADIMALPKLADAVVGRMSVLTLYPLSALEIAQGDGNFLKLLFSNGFKAGSRGSDENLTTMIGRATFPEITDQDTAARRRWFESYITTILQRDVRQIADIEKLGVLPNLLRVLASRSGGLINAADIGRSIGQNAVTSKNYRILLQAMYLAIDVKPWYRNIGKRLVKSAKGYIVDTSLLCHLQQIDLSVVAGKDPHVFGQVYENFVASELMKQLAHTEVQAELYHFRTSDGQEVDFVLEQPGGLLAAIEAKARDAVSEEDFKGLKELRKQAGDDFICGIVLYSGRNIVPFDERLWAVPVNSLWSY